MAGIRATSQALLCRVMQSSAISRSKAIGNNRHCSNSDRTGSHANCNLTLPRTLMRMPPSLQMPPVLLTCRKSPVIAQSAYHGQGRLGMGTRIPQIICGTALEDFPTTSAENTADLYCGSSKIPANRALSISRQKYLSTYLHRMHLQRLAGMPQDTRCACCRSPGTPSIAKADGFLFCGLQGLDVLTCVNVMRCHA